jgi:tetratricopeptide (TPR) repeat protein
MVPDHALTSEWTALKPRTRALLIAAAVVVALIAAFDQLGWMHRRFFGASAVSARALGHYLVGDYAGAARFYRDDLRRIAALVPSEQGGSWVMLARGDVDQAESQAKVESRLAPTDPEPILTLAEAALARRDWRAALAHAGRVLALRRDNYDALLITAVAQSGQGAYPLAIDALKRALRYDYAERRLTVFLSVLETTGELNGRAFDQRPYCLLAHLHQYLRLYDPAEARLVARYAQRAIEVGDRADDAHVMLAIVHTKEGRPSRALAAFQQAVAVNPRNTAALLGQARYRAKRGELAEEYRLTRAAFEADPDDPFVAEAFHGVLMQKLGDYRQALAVAEAAVARSPRNAEALWRLGHVQAQVGELRPALASYQQAAQLTPRTAELENSIAQVLRLLGRDDEALAGYRRALALDPLRPQPHYGLGALHGKARRWDEAMREYEMGYALGGRDVAQVVSLCEVYWETGRKGDASSCVSDVLTRDPANVQGQALRELLHGAQRSASAAR